MPEYDIGSFPERLMSASRGLANSPQDCSPRHCGAVALFDFSSPNPKKRPLRRDTTQGSLFGAADGSRTHVLSLEG